MSSHWQRSRILSLTVVLEPLRALFFFSSASPRLRVNPCSAQWVHDERGYGTSLDARGILALG